MRRGLLFSAMCSVPFMVIAFARLNAEDEKREITDIGAARVDGDISAPVHYDDQMLVISTDDGMAAVVFGSETATGVKYSYRFESADGKTQSSGDDELFETRLPTREYAGRLRIRAGGVQIGWSYGGARRGWIYYTPEKVRVQLADAATFADRPSKFSPPGEPPRLEKKLDLRRFLMPNGD